MGNHRFRLSDMIPNAWFYKLKHMGTRTTKAQNKKHHLPPPPAAAASPPPPPKPHPHLHHNPRQSYHFTRDDSPPDPFLYNLAPSHLPDPPRISAKKRKSTNKRSSKKSNSPRLVTTSVSADCSCRASLESVWTKPDSTTEEYPNSTSSENESLFPEYGSDRGSIDNMPSWSPAHTPPCNCKSQTDNVSDFHSVSTYEKFETLDLPPIITKKNEPTQLKKTSTKIIARNAHGSLSVKVAKEDIVGISQKEQRTSPVKKFSVNSPGMKLRTNSPRIGSRKVHVNHRKSVSSIPTASSRRTDSFAVVKSSRDPHRDFKDSMVEMIMQNNIKGSKELEDLLACYLSLNSDEYHDMIIKVFKQIWFDTVEIRLE